MTNLNQPTNQPNHNLVKNIFRISAKMSYRQVTLINKIIIYLIYGQINVVLTATSPDINHLVPELLKVTLSRSKRRRVVYKAKMQ